MGKTKSSVKTAAKTVEARGRQLVAVAERLRDAGLNWVQLQNALYGPGGKYSELFPTQADRLAFSGSAADEAIGHILDGLPESPSAAALPDVVEAPSGKLNVRMPKSVHAALSQEAKSEGVSLNALIVSKLAVQLRAAVRQ
jgi:hypothetical protein